MKFLKSILFIFVILLGLAGLGIFIAKDNPDPFAQMVNQLNPLLPEDEVFVKIKNKNAVDLDGYGNYTYSLTGYDQNGNERQMRFSGMGKLKEDHYLKLMAKGTYVRTYEEVLPTDMSRVVLEKLK